MKLSNELVMKLSLKIQKMPHNWVIALNEKKKKKWCCNCKLEFSQNHFLITNVRGNEGILLAVVNE